MEMDKCRYNNNDESHCSYTNIQLTVAFKDTYCDIMAGSWNNGARKNCSLLG
jgi:hypothetical protein